MSGLLDLLFGANGPSGAPAPKWGYDADGYLTQNAMPQPPAPGALVNQTAAASPAVPLAQSAVNPPQPPQPPQGQGDPITIQGDSWQPKKAGVLGQIADYFLGTHFGKNTVRQNEEGALEHLTSNPIEAVRRMSKFDPQGAQALYSQVMREQHQGAIEKHQSDVYENMAENQAMGIARNMAMTATPENSAAVQQQITRYLQAKGVNQSLIDTIPDANGSLDDFKTFAQGGVPAGRQAALVEQARNHDIQHGDRAASLGERSSFHQGLLGQGAARIGVSQGNLDERQSHDDVTEQQGQERIDRNGPGVPTMTKYGPGMISADGNTLTINNPTHGALQYIKVGNSWHLAKTKPNKGHDITVNQ